MSNKGPWTDLVRIGDASDSTKHFVPFENILAFARLTGDFEPIHVDTAYAKRTPYGHCLAHGVFVLGLMSDKLLAEDKVGPNVSYGYDRVRFIRPVVAGSTVITKGRIVESRPERNQVVVEETCHSEDGDLLAIANHVFRFI